MPGWHRELAGDQDGAAAMAIFDDFHEIAPFERHRVALPYPHHRARQPLCLVSLGPK
jgi:hypothetical protein